MNTSIIVAIGLLLILFGIITPKYPKLLSFFNTFSDEKSKSPEVKKAIQVICSFLILGGSFIIIGILLSLFIKWISSIYTYIFLFSILLPSIFSIYYFLKLTNNGISRLIYLSIFLALTTLTIIMFVSFSIETIVLTENQQIKIKGRYGESIRYDDVKKIEITDFLPKIKWRSNGYAFGNTRVGYFKSEDNETVKLFLYSSKPPYLFILKDSGEKIFINFEDPNKTLQLYNELREQ